MGKYDVALCNYLSDNDRFAEIFNAAEFGGEPVLHGDMLESDDSRHVALCAKEKKHRNGPNIKPKTYFRDIKKRTRNGEWLVITAIENQENIDYTMPLRIMEYDCMEYRTQVRKIQSEKEKQILAEGAKPCAFNTQPAKEDKLHPIYTVCFYHGTRPWEGPKSLKDMMDFQNALPGWKERFHDYGISLFCADEVTDLSRFKTGVRQFLEVIALRSNREKLIELWSREEYRHLDRDTAEVIAILTDTSSVLERLDEYEKEGEYDMCQAMDEWREELLAKGKAEGVEQGIEQGITKAILNLMYSLKLSADQAMEMLLIPEEKRDLYRAKI